MCFLNCRRRTSHMKPLLSFIHKHNPCTLPILGTVPWTKQLLVTFHIPAEQMIRMLLWRAQNSCRPQYCGSNRSEGNPPPLKTSPFHTHATSRPISCNIRLVTDPSIHCLTVIHTQKGPKKCIYTYTSVAGKTTVPTPFFWLSCHSIRWLMHSRNQHHVPTKLEVVTWH
jgi:hypothetical protein